MSELQKEAKIIQFHLHFVGFGDLPIVHHTDASVARHFVCKMGCGRMKSMEIHYMWLQDEYQKGKLVAKKIPRDEHPGDLLTHAPSPGELAKFMTKLGMFPITCSRSAMKIVEAALNMRPSMQPAIMAVILSFLPKEARGEDYYPLEIEVAEVDGLQGRSGNH